MICYERGSKFAISHCMIMDNCSAVHYIALHCLPYTNSFTQYFCRFIGITLLTFCFCFFLASFPPVSSFDIHLQHFSKHPHPPHPLLDLHQTVDCICSKAAVRTAATAAAMTRKKEPLTLSRLCCNLLKGKYKGRTVEMGKNGMFYYKLSSANSITF